MTPRGHRPAQYDTANPDGSLDTVEVYAGDPRPDGTRLWYWHRKARNHRVVGDGGQGYTRKDSALRAARSRHPQTGNLR